MIKLWTFAATLVVGAAVGGSPPALAAKAGCGDRAKVIDGLRNQLQRSHLFGLETSAGQVFELFRDQYGRWTAVMHTAQGKSCIVATGEALTIISELPGWDA